MGPIDSLTLGSTESNERSWTPDPIEPLNPMIRLGQMQPQVQPLGPILMTRLGSWELLGVMIPLGTTIHRTMESNECTGSLWVQ